MQRRKAMNNVNRMNINMNCQLINTVNPNRNVKAKAPHNVSANSPTNNNNNSVYSITNKQ